MFIAEMLHFLRVVESGEVSEDNADVLQSAICKLHLAQYLAIADSKEIMTSRILVMEP